MNFEGPMCSYNGQSGKHSAFFLSDGSYIATTWFILPDDEDGTLQYNRPFIYQRLLNCQTIHLDGALTIYSLIKDLS